jgi:hypothetical protein
MAVSSPFENDPYGGSAQNRYDELIGVLAEKYGTGDSVHKLGDGLYKEPNFFVAGIRQGETVWFTNFANSDLFIRWVSLLQTKIHFDGVSFTRIRF